MEASICPHIVVEETTGMSLFGREPFFHSAERKEETEDKAIFFTSLPFFRRSSVDFSLLLLLSFDLLLSKDEEKRESATGAAPTSKS